MNTREINAAVKRVLKSGHWMLRRSNDGKSYGGFQWQPIGEWTEAPDWQPTAKCGHGLHGNTATTSNYWTDGADLDFCEYDPADVVMMEDKIKVRRARVLLRNELPKGITLRGFLDLSGTDLKGVTLPQTVGGSLILSECDLEDATLPKTVGGDLYLRGTGLKGVILPQTVGGSFILHGCSNIPQRLPIVKGEIYQ